MACGVAYRRLLDADDPAWRPLIDLYTKVFEEGQRETERALLQNLVTPRTPRVGGHLVIVAEGDRAGCVGGVIFSYLPTINCGYVSYIFVQPTLRDRGIGIGLLEALRSTLSLEASQYDRGPVRRDLCGDPAKRSHSGCPAIALSVLGARPGSPPRPRLALPAAAQWPATRRHVSGLWPVRPPSRSLVSRRSRRSRSGDLRRHVRLPAVGSSDPRVHSQNPRSPSSSCADSVHAAVAASGRTSRLSLAR